MVRIEDLMVDKSEEFATQELQNLLLKGQQTTYEAIASDDEE